MFIYSGFREWVLTKDLQTYAGDAHGSQPVSSRCLAATHPTEKESVQLDNQGFSGTHQSTDDLSDLCLQDLGDFNLSDLDMSTAMIDYLLGWSKKQLFGRELHIYKHVYC